MSEPADRTTAEAEGIVARYVETDRERLLVFERETGDGDGSDATAGERAVVAQNRDGYAMLLVRRTVAGDELERYYGLDMALDHAAELLGVAPGYLPIPATARDMGI